MNLGGEFSMLAWLSANAALVAALAAVLPIVWAVVQFVIIRRGEAQRSAFETYHHLIKELVESDSADRSPKVDRQVAIIFELPRFESYRPVSLRILRGLRKDWDGGHPRVIEELDLAIAALGGHPTKE